MWGKAKARGAVTWLGSGLGLLARLSVGLGWGLVWLTSPVTGRTLVS